MTRLIRYAVVLSFLLLPLSSYAADIRDIDPELRSEFTEYVADQIGISKSQIDTYLRSPKNLEVTPMTDTPEGTYVRMVSVHVMLDSKGQILPLKPDSSEEQVQGDAAFNPCRPLKLQPEKLAGPQFSHVLSLKLTAPQYNEAEVEAGMVPYTAVQANLIDGYSLRIEESSMETLTGQGRELRSEALKQALDGLNFSTNGPRQEAPPPDETQETSFPDPESCMVRMIAHPVNSTMTYDPQGDYTEYAGPDGQAMYARTGKMAFHDPGGSGWTEMPVTPEQMERPMELGPMDMLGPDEFNPEAEMARMPYYMVKAMSWERMSNLEPESPKNPISAVDCMDSQDRCMELQVTVDGLKTSLIYDDRYRLIRAHFPDESVLTFDYGSFDIRRPPGW